MDYKKYSKILENQPNGLINRLKYFEYELDKLSSSDTKIKKRIISEIDNIQKDLSVYDELLNQKTKVYDNDRVKLTDITNKNNSFVTFELNRLPKNKIYFLSALFGVFFTLTIYLYLASYYVHFLISFLIVCFSGVIVANYLYPLYRIRNESKKNVALLYEGMKIYEQVEDLKQEILFAKKREQLDKNSNKHFENSEWLEEKVLEFESIGNSQNKSVELTRELYEKEFDRKPPGKSTILRYMGRYSY